MLQGTQGVGALIACKCFFARATACTHPLPCAHPSRVLKSTRGGRSLCGKTAWPQLLPRLPPPPGPLWVRQSTRPETGSIALKGADQRRTQSAVRRHRAGPGGWGESSMSSCQTCHGLKQGQHAQQARCPGSLQSGQVAQCSEEHVACRVCGVALSLRLLQL